MALCAASLAACSATSAPSIALDSVNPHHAVVIVTGLSRGDLSALDRAHLSADEWTSVMRVTVYTRPGASAPMAVAGRYDIADGRVRFTPMLPFEPGRSYEIVFDPGAVPATRLRQIPKASRLIGVPLDAPTAPARVANV